MGDTHHVKRIKNTELQRLAGYCSYPYGSYNVVFWCQQFGEIQYWTIFDDVETDSGVTRPESRFLSGRQEFRCAAWLISGENGKVKDDFFKFPSTPHLFIFEGLEVRGDKVLPESEMVDFLRHEITVEEKVDGANLGISFNLDARLVLQNRGSYLELPGAGQWKKLDQWLSPKMDALFENLTDRYILFGEWCYAQHSVFYNHLPDWFLGFDVYDKYAEKFLSVEQRDQLFEQIKIHKVPQLGSGVYSFSEIKELLAKSEVSDEPAEGLYLRVDKDGWLLKRAKLVRPSFIQSVDEHWSRSAIKPNQLDSKIWGHVVGD